MYADQINYGDSYSIILDAAIKRRFSTTNIVHPSAEDIYNTRDIVERKLQEKRRELTSKTK